jgi:hypothetical protein
MAGTSDFTAKARICKGVTCLGSNKAGLFRTPESFNPGKAVCKICQVSEPEKVPHYMPIRKKAYEHKKPAAKPPPSPVVKPEPIAKPGQGVTAEKATTAGCSACGVKWDKHDGLAKTCGKLGKARSALAIIYTWAKFRDEPDLFDRANVLGLCGRVLAELKPQSA